MWARRSSLVALPMLFAGAAGTGYGGMGIYSGYASKDWPSTRAVTTDFRIVPVSSISSYLFGETYDFIVDFKYSIPPDPKKPKETYVGTSRRDPNFPVRLSLGCAPCRAQAEQITAYFGEKKHRKFNLYYHPSLVSIPYLTQRLRKSKKKKGMTEGLFPLYTLDPGVIVEEVYMYFAAGSTMLLGALSGLRQKWRARLWGDTGTAMGLFCVLALVCMGITYLLARYLEAQLDDHKTKKDK